eukprot:COSAG05_NODE_12022_length_486_cov_1.661499_1_plen_49_part_10
MSRLRTQYNRPTIDSLRDTQQLYEWAQIDNAAGMAIATREIHTGRCPTE